MFIIPPDLPAFIIASVLLALVPGPDLLFVLTEAMLRGRRAGLVASLGLCTGLLVHISAVALGVAALVQASPLVFAAVRYVGAAYLLYLAWQAFRSAATSFAAGDAPRVSLRATYARAVTMNVANPKVAIFFLAFLPQFVDPERGGLIGQMLILGAAFMACSLLCFAGVTRLADRIGDWVRREPGRQAGLSRTASLVFVVLAAKLAL
jgi:threonine/homoserine/homoserine lactone efflux protein